MVFWWKPLVVGAVKDDGNEKVTVDWHIQFKWGQIQTPCRKDAESGRAVKLGRVSSVSQLQQSLSLVFAALW